jgi:hypothetical protein
MDAALYRALARKVFSRTIVGMPVALRLTEAGREPE